MISLSIVENIISESTKSNFNRGHGGVCINFVLLAKGTALNIAADEGGESGPPEFGGD